MAHLIGRCIHSRRTTNSVRSAGSQCVAMRCAMHGCCFRTTAHIWEGSASSIDAQLDCVLPNTDPNPTPAINRTNTSRAPTLRCVPVCVCVCLAVQFLGSRRPAMWWAGSVSIRMHTRRLSRWDGWQVARIVEPPSSAAWVRTSSKLL